MIYATKYKKKKFRTKRSTSIVSTIYMMTCDVCDSDYESPNETSSGCSRICSFKTIKAMPGVSEKWRTSMRASHADPVVKEKRKQSFKKPETIAKMKAAQLRSSADPLVRERMMATNKIIGSRPEVRAKRSATLKRLYAEHGDEIKAKEHATKKKNGSYAKSKGEDKLHEFLCEKFGIDNIDRPVRVNGWSIDFYIKSIDTYVQFDGKFYHWIGRPVEDLHRLITETGKPTYQVVLKTVNRDIEQVKWFAENGLKLVRVIERQPFENYFT